MKKLDNFINCLAVLANADFKMAETNDIYRTGIIGQFNKNQQEFSHLYRW